MIPTLASNCAPWTPLSVMYKEDGTSEGKSEHYFRQAAFMITEPNLVVDAPVNYFVAELSGYYCEMVRVRIHLSPRTVIRRAVFTNGKSCGCDLQNNHFNTSLSKRFQTWKKERLLVNL